MLTTTTPHGPISKFPSWCFWDLSTAQNRTVDTGLIMSIEFWPMVSLDEKGFINTWQTGNSKSIDAVNWESPSSGQYKSKSDVDVVFAGIPTARCRLRINSVYYFHFSWLLVAVLDGFLAMASCEQFKYRSIWSFSHSLTNSILFYFYHGLTKALILFCRTSLPIVSTRCVWSTICP